METHRSNANVFNAWTLLRNCYSQVYSTNFYMSHLKTKLFLTGFFTIQAFCMIQGYSTTSHTVVLEAQDMPKPEVIVVKPKETVKPKIVKPQTVIEGVNKDKREYAKRIVKERTILYFGEEQWSAMEAIVTRESGFNPDAQNPKSTAYGLFQFLDATWKGQGCVKTSDIVTQVECGIKYIQNRYGSVENAWKFWQENKWY